MAGIFEGIGQGLGQAALGAGRGKLQGAIQTQQMKRQDEQDEYRKHQLKLQQEKLKFELTPAQRVAQAFLQDANRKLMDQEFVDYLAQSPEANRKFLGRVRRAQDVTHGRAHSFDMLEEDADLDGMPDAPQPAPANPMAAAPSIAPAPRATSPELQALAAPAREGLAMLNPAIAGVLRPEAPRFAAGIGEINAPRAEPNRFPVQAGGRTLTPPEMPEISPSVVSQGGRTQIPVDPSQEAPGTSGEPVEEPTPDYSPEGIQRQVLAIQQESPRPQRPTEPAKAYQTYLRDFKADKSRRIRGLTQMATAFPRGIILGQDAKDRPGMNAAKKEGLLAGAERDREGAEDSRQLRGLKKSNYASMILKRANDTNQRTRQLDETARHNKVSEDIAWMNARTNEARQVSEADYQEAMKGKIQFTIDHFDELELGKDDRAVLEYAGRILTAQQGIGPIRGSAAGAEGATALKRAEEIFQRIEAKRQAVKAKPKTTPTTRQTTRTSGTITGRAGGGGGAPLSPAEVAHVKSVGRDNFAGWAAGLPPEMQKRANMAAKKLGWTK